MKPLCLFGLNKTTAPEETENVTFLIIVFVKMRFFDGNSKWMQSWPLLLVASSKKKEKKKLLRVSVAWKPWFMGSCDSRQDKKNKNELLCRKQFHNLLRRLFFFLRISNIVFLVFSLIICTFFKSFNLINKFRTLQRTLQLTAHLDIPSRSSFSMYRKIRCGEFVFQLKVEAFKSMV